MCANAQQKSVTYTTIQEKNIIPEGIAYQARAKKMFISSVHLQKIVQIDSVGQASDFIHSQEYGFGEGVGLIVDNKTGELWACSHKGDTAMVFRFRISPKKLLYVYKLFDGRRHFFNDLLIHDTGKVYITDTEGNSIYEINSRNHHLHLFFTSEQLGYPNGITSFGHKLFIASFLHGLHSLDLRTKQLSHLAQNGQDTHGIDGLMWFAGTLIGIVNASDDVAEQKIIQCRLDKRHTRIENISTLDAGNIYFEEPTTGVIVDNVLYCLANSQLQRYNKAGKEIRAPDTWKSPIILQYQLKR
jgi:hypothetical protein